VWWANTSNITGRRHATRSSTADAPAGCCCCCCCSCGVSSSSAFSADVIAGTGLNHISTWQWQSEVISICSAYFRLGGAAIKWMLERTLLLQQLLCFIFPEQTDISNQLISGICSCILQETHKTVIQHAEQKAMKENTWIRGRYTSLSLVYKVRLCRLLLQVRLVTVLYCDVLHWPSKIQSTKFSGTLAAKWLNYGWATNDISVTRNDRRL